MTVGEHREAAAVLAMRSVKQSMVCICDHPLCYGISTLYIYCISHCTYVQCNGSNGQDDGGAGLGGIQLVEGVIGRVCHWLERGVSWLESCTEGPPPHWLESVWILLVACYWL
jgi:hypothetical protein